MALHLHRAARTDALADGLGALLATPPPDPFAPEVVVVPARGVERWLSQRLSHLLGAAPGRGDGVCAGVDFRRPAALIAEVTGTRDADPWVPDALVWPLLETVDGCLDEPWAGPLAAHLGYGLAGEEAELRRGRRFAVGHRLARLFASYADQRPSLIADWHAGRDTDGCGRPLAGDLGWQPELWRRTAALVGDRTGVPPPHLRHRQVVDRLRSDPGAFDLPARLSLFGHTRLSVTDADLLAALGEHRDLHLWLPHPSAELWRDLAAAGADRPVPRAEDDSHERVRHRLLATLGRDVRELQRTLGPSRPAEHQPPATPQAEPSTLLGWLQADLRANRQPGAATVRARVVDRRDRSVQVHACHGPARQVEVLREVLLGLLADDPTLQPRDVLVMCPDIEAFAPLVTAAFGLGDVVAAHGHPGHRLRVLLADRSLSRANPLLEVAARLLDLAGGRAGAADVLDLARSAPVRRRFGFTDDDLAQLTTWVTSSGVRWAFDAEHRREFGLDGYLQNTWRFGLDRLLAGVTMSEDAQAWLGVTLPLDDVGSGQVDLAGRLAEYVDRLADVTDQLVGAHPLTHWLSALEEGVAAVAAAPASEAWQQAQLRRELGRVAEQAAAAGDLPLRLPDVRALLADRLAGRPTRANFRTGTLTVCTMVPMRSVPHRVVCLLGLDDGVFPRVGTLDGDDVLARDPMTGERDPRSEDRQLLLDAVLAATETLVVTYTGADEYTGRPRPPAVPLGELLDTVDETATAAGGRVSAAVVTRHPLQPFDLRNLDPGALVPGSVFTFDRAAAAGATAAAGPRAVQAPFLEGPLPPAPAGDLSLEDLVGFFKHPVRAFLRTRLDLALAEEDEPVPDGLPVEIDHLAQWRVGERLLADLLAGADPGRAAEQEWRRGELPPGRLGWRLLQELGRRAAPLAEAAAALREGAGTPVDVDVDLGGGRRLRGTVPEVYGDRLVTVSYSRLAAGHRVSSWLAVLALTATHPDRGWAAHTLGRPPGQSREQVARSLLGPLTGPGAEGPGSPAAAAGLLRDLVAVRDEGLSEPLPLPVKASYTYARWRRTGADPAEAQRRAGFDWNDGRFPGERSDPAHRRAFGKDAPLPGLGRPPAADERARGEPTRFGALAVRVWGPLLAAERGAR